MKSRFLMVIFLIAGVIGVGLMFLPEKEPKPAIPDVPLPAQLTPEQIEDQKLIASINEEIKAAQEKGDGAKEKSAIRALSEAIGGRVGGMVGMSLDGLNEHVMHGVVLDQNKQPVGGALVRIGYGPSGLLHGHGQSRVYTDALGRFTTTGKGGGISISGVDHPQLTRYKYASSQTDGTVKRNGYKQYHYVNNTPEKPVIVNVWRINTFEDVTRNINQNAIWSKPTGEPRIQNKLKMTCQRGPFKGYKAKEEELTDWYVRLEPAEPGGFKRTLEAYIEQAPASGYDIPYLEFQRTLGDDMFRKRINQQETYYFKSGGSYGVVKLSGIEPFDRGGKCYISLKFDRYNNQGGRSLALPRDKDLIQ